MFRGSSYCSTSPPSHRKISTMSTQDLPQRDLHQRITTLYLECTTPLSSTNHLYTRGIGTKPKHNHLYIRGTGTKPKHNHLYTRGIGTKPKQRTDYNLGDPMITNNTKKI